MQVSVANYLKAPCAALSIPYWKAKAVQVPAHMRIVHQRDLSEVCLDDYDDEPYFRLLHPLDEVDFDPPRWLDVRTARREDIPLIVHLINASYPDLRVDAEQLMSYTRSCTYDGALWVIAYDRDGDVPVGCGIADLDRELREGSLEWIQVLPAYRRRGVGRALVMALIFRMRGKADFATVSGKVRNDTAPEQLYRRCGFAGNDIWHVLTRKKAGMQIGIHAVASGERLYAKTAELAKRCSFQGSGQYLNELMTEDALEAGEQVWCAVADDRVVGFCALMKESCCEDGRTPWLDFLFVQEAYRGRGIARQMVEAVQRHAIHMGFDALYLCTASHETYYRRLGFVTAADVQINECTPGKLMHIALSRLKCPEKEETP